MSVPLRSGYGVRLPTVGGTKEERYSGVNALTILKKRNCLCFCLLAASVSQPVSERRLAIAIFDQVRHTAACLAT